MQRERYTLLLTITHLPANLHLSNVHKIIRMWQLLQLCWQSVMLRYLLLWRLAELRYMLPWRGDLLRHLLLWRVVLLRYLLL